MIVSRNLYVMASTVSLASIGVAVVANPGSTCNVFISSSVLDDRSERIGVKVPTSENLAIEMRSEIKASPIFAVRSGEHKRKLTVAESGVLRSALFSSVRIKKTIARA